MELILATDEADMTMANAHWNVSLQDFPSALPIQVQLRYLLRYAILAPSTKNTQPWQFSIGENTVGIFADVSRWQRVSDSGRRELYISLGCALENLVVAAEHFGFHTDVRYLPLQSNEDLAATITFRPAVGVPNRSPSTLQAIIARYTERGFYRADPIAEPLRLRLLESGSAPGLRLDLTDDPTIRARVLELNLHADEMEFGDPKFRKELGYWVGQGVFGKPGLQSRVAGFILTRLNLGRFVGKRNASILSSAPLIGLISARTDDRASQVRTGQALERLWLQATRLGIGLQPMSQALEIPALRTELARVISEREWIPEQVFRLGYPIHPERRHTPRRPVDQVLLS